MVALSPQCPEALEELRTERHLTFPILVDSGNRVAAQFGIRHVLPPELRDVYLSFGLDLPAANGEDSWSLPMPARYLIDRSGIIRGLTADPDYTSRPEPEETLTALAALH